MEIFLEVLASISVQHKNLFQGILFLFYWYFSKVKIALVINFVDRGIGSIFLVFSKCRTCHFLFCG